MKEKFLQNPGIHRADHNPGKHLAGHGSACPLGHHTLFGNQYKVQNDAWMYGIDHKEYFR